MKRSISVFVLLILFGCGQSGPLYLPGNPSRVENPPAPAEEAGDEEGGEENGDDGGNQG